MESNDIVEKKGGSISRLMSGPLITAIIGGVISILVLFIQKRQELSLEKQKFQYHIIEKIIERDTSKAKAQEELLFYSKLGFLEGIIKDTVVNGKDSTIFKVVVPVAINTAPNDCPMFSIANFTTREGENEICWNKNFITGSKSDIINLAIYYHNSEQYRIENLSFRVTDFRGGVIEEGQDVFFQAKILSGDVVISSGVVRLRLKSGRAIMMVNNIVDYNWTENLSKSITNGANIFSKEGLFKGDLPPGWEKQGVIKLSFTLKPI